MKNFLLVLISMHNSRTFGDLDRSGTWGFICESLHCLSSR